MSKALKVGLAFAAAFFVVIGLAWAEQVNIETVAKWFKAPIYIGKYSDINSGRAAISNRITGSYSNGPGVSTGNALIYQFPAVATSACEDSTVLTIDAGASGANVAVQFGDTLEMGMDQILPQDDAGVLITPYVYGKNQVAFRYCNFTGRSFGLPDASYWVRSFSNQ